MQISDRNIILILILIQLIVTIPFINSFPIALDEPFSIFYAQQDLSEFIPVINNGNNSSLHFILLHFWIKLFGISPIAVRSLSLVFSLFTIIVLYKLSKKITNRNFGILTVLIFIFTSFNHFYSLEARMYSLFSFLFILIVFIIYLILEEKKNLFLLLIIANIALFYTHYLSVFVFLTEFVIALFYYKKIKNFKKIIISFSLIIISILPGLFILMNKEDDLNTGWVRQPHITEVYGNVLRFFNGMVVLISILVLLVIYFLISKKNKKINWRLLFNEYKFYYLSLWFFVPYLSMYVFSILFTPIFIDRYLIFTSLPLYMLFVFLVYFLISKNNIVILLISIPLILTLNYSPDSKRSVNEQVRYVNSQNLNNKVIYFAPPWIQLQFLYHFDRSIFKDYSSILNLENEIFKTIYTEEEIDLQSSFILINSIEGHIKEIDNLKMRLINSHNLKSTIILDDIYYLYNFELK